MTLVNLKKKVSSFETDSKEKKVFPKENLIYGLDRSKHFPSSVREWTNSIYCFDKNNLDLIPHSSISAKLLIESFFQAWKKKLEDKIRTRRLSFRLRRLSLTKIFLSNSQFKHSNNKVLISLYVFNKQKLNYIQRIKNIYLSRINKKKFKLFLIKTSRLTEAKFFSILKRKSNNNYLLKRALLILKNNPAQGIYYNALRDYRISFYKKQLKKYMKKYRLFFLHKQLIYLNDSKTNYTYLRILKKNLEVIFNKNVEFNLINLKRFYLNSDILNETVKLKITKKRNKLNLLVKKLKNKIKIQKKAFFSGFNVLKSLQEKKIFVLNNLKYRHVTGFRLEAKGRLTRRYTASRSLSKAVYAGNLLNMDSSKRGLSSVLLKGNLKSNIQFSKVQYKTRIGSFGLKGWISGN